MVDLITIGAINWDTNIWVDRFPAAGEEVPVKNITRVPGGKAANVAVAAARACTKKKVALFGAVGEDSVGKDQVRILVQEGVDVSHIKFVHGIESGQAYITIDRNGSNFIETYFGANHELLPRDLLEPSRLSAIYECSVIAISDPLISTAERIAALGSERGASILYDAGTKLQVGFKKLRKVLEHTSVLIMNSVEAQRLTRSTDPTTVRKMLTQQDLDLEVVVKLGEKGCAYCSRNDETLRLPALPLEKLGLKVVNTTGCGDTFLGVLAASMTQGFSRTESLERATVAAGLKASGAETRSSPREETIENTLKIWKTKS